MPRFGRPLKTRNRWWTRERVVEAGARFYLQKGCAPTSEEWWHAETQFTANVPGGLSGKGPDRPYPCGATIKNFWKGMREYWLEVSKKHPELELMLDKGDTPWTPLEEWFVTESVGIFPREEVAKLMAESGMGRTEAAIKRRLYELGVGAYNRWGWTINHFAAVTGVSGAVVTRYIDHGLLPFMQGNKCLYIDPADFPIIKEYNWSKKHHPPELEKAVRQALMQRLCYVLAGFNWRAYSYHRIAPRKEFYTGRIRNPRKALPAKPTAKPNVKVGDWVSVSGEWNRGPSGRVGQVKSVVWSPHARAATQKTPGRPACWMATVEFPKMKIHGKPTRLRVHYNIPATSLEKTRKPYGLEPGPRVYRSRRKAGRPKIARSERTRSPTSLRKKDQLAKARGREILKNKLALPTKEVSVPPSERGQRVDLVSKLKVAV